MYLAHNVGKSAVVERFIKTLKDKIYEKIAANDNQSYFGYSNKLVGEYNNIYHSFIGKKLFVLIILCYLKKLNQLLKLLNLKLVTESG